MNSIKTSNLKPSRLKDVYSEFKKINPVLNVEVVKAALVFSMYTDLIEERKTQLNSYKYDEMG